MSESLILEIRIPNELQAALVRRAKSSKWKEATDSVERTIIDILRDTLTGISSAPWDDEDDSDRGIGGSFQWDE